jgi:hypothetical protein
MTTSKRAGAGSVAGAFLGVAARIGELAVRRTIEFVQEAREEVLATFGEARRELDAELDEHRRDRTEPEK